MRNLLQTIWRIITAPFRLISWIVKSIIRWVGNTLGGIRVLFSEEPEDATFPESLAKAIANPMSILEHIDALRKNLFRALLFLILSTALAFIFTRELLDWLAQPIGGIETLQAIEVTEPLGVVMRVALLAGFSVSLPYITFELWLFAAPGLKRRSRISGLLTIPVAFLFFVAGMAFAYYIMMPTALPFLISFMDIPTAIRPSSYVRFVTGLMFWIGAAFEFPLVIFTLAGMGLVRAQTLAAQWRIAIVIIAIAAAAITPTIDPVNMGLVMGPMIVLYFLSIGLAYIAQGRRGRS
ncbi:MAG: twin-arginine translocase subunit TatC [Chloroflexi bacterium]|nr:twin-arginine translocase subunit TatC [Chloroflexota bacterium]MBU1661505.1 twin-arginine translocase subunit TatC [Chloroflexota bacterium]